MKVFIISMLAVLGFVNANPEVGKPAPDFELTDYSGKSVKLSQFKGKTVVLEWYNKDCPYVRKHYDSKNMQTIQTYMKLKGVEWLTIVSSAKGKQGHMDAKLAAETLGKEGMTVSALLNDETGKVGGLFKAKTTPHMYLIGEDGNLLYQGAIDSDNSASAKSIEGAKNYLVAAVESSMKKEKIVDSVTKPYGCSVKY